MKIDDIDAFVEVIRCQSISHAAASLQLTQPAITRRVQNFEQALGVELFDRNTKPLKPTLIGTRVYEQCRLILREMDALRELVATDAPPTGVLRLGVPQTIGDVVLLDALKHLRSEYA
ncbi:LysR family transcriptional regulator, partial [Pseudomonas carnis]